LSNSEKEREALNLKKKTVSVWSYANHPKQQEKFLNKLFNPTAKLNKHLSITPSQDKIVLWSYFHTGIERTFVKSFATVLSGAIANICKDLNSTSNQQSCNTDASSTNNTNTTTVSNTNANNSDEVAKLTKENLHLRTELETLKNKLEVLQKSANISQQ